ncbi:hypothetical protein [Pseudomonas urmiensis]|uniref:hypothetical protein n=1 Tax=Pseudomonas urmiensis TaxID=2745493 RepID=UPI003C930852
MTEMTEDQKLAHGLKMKFGLGMGEPTLSQLRSIKQYIQSIRDQGHKPTHSDWEFAVNRYCPGSGTGSYSGIDNSDLNALFLLAITPKKSK